MKKRPGLRMKHSGTVKQVGRRTHRKQANMRMMIGRISQEFSSPWCSTRVVSMAIIVWGNVQNRKLHKTALEDSSSWRRCLTSIFHKCLERWASLNKACLDALSAVDQLDQQIMLICHRPVGTIEKWHPRPFRCHQRSDHESGCQSGRPGGIEWKNGRGMASLEMIDLLFWG